jgi:hypothetical protein
VIIRPPGIGVFQFVVLSTLRAAQLMKGCTPRVDGSHKPIVTAQVEVAEGKVVQLFDDPIIDAAPAILLGHPLEELAASSRVA